MNVTTEKLPVVVPKELLRAVYDKKYDDRKPPFGDGKVILYLDNFLQDGESSVLGKVMRKRAKEKGNLASQLYSECLLLLRKGIPREWRNFILIFPEKFYRHPKKRVLCAPCLGREGNEWVQGHVTLGGIFGSSFRLVRYRLG